MTQLICTCLPPNYSYHLEIAMANHTSTRILYCWRAFYFQFLLLEILGLKVVVGLLIIAILCLELYLRHLKFFAGQRGFPRLLYI